MQWIRGKRLVLATVVLFALAGGIAYASIPDGDGTYHACMLKGIGTIRIIDPAKQQRCSTALETEITFNQKGQPGADGASPSVLQLGSGDANCPAGGAAITDAAGHTAYVCSGQKGADGAPFSGTFTSPNGRYSISVTDAGVDISDSGNQVVRVTGNTLTLHPGTDLLVTAGGKATINVATTVAMQSGNDVSLKVGGDLTTDVQSTLNLKASGGGTLQTGGTLAVKGSQIALNGGSSCSPAARMGDTVGGNVIVTGSPTVCIG
jgi:hypothetical protein